MGAPVGNQNAAKSRMFEQALIRAIKARDAEAKEDGATLRKICENLLDVAATEIAAMVQVRDTLDGKPAQAITGADGGPLVVIQATAHDEAL